MKEPNLSPEITDDTKEFAVTEESKVPMSVSDFSHISLIWNICQRFVLSVVDEELAFFDQAVNNRMGDQDALRLMPGVLAQVLWNPDPSGPQPVHSAIIGNMQYGQITTLVIVPSEDFGHCVAAVQLRVLPPVMQGIIWRQWLHQSRVKLLPSQCPLGLFQLDWLGVIADGKHNKYLHIRIKVGQPQIVELSHRAYNVLRSIQDDDWRRSRTLRVEHDHSVILDEDLRSVAER